VTDVLDLLADGGAVRHEVRAMLAGWKLEDLAAVQESATGYPEGIWEAFRRRIGPRMSEPEAVIVALEELGGARCPLPVHAGLIQPLAAALALGPAERRLREAVLESGDRYALARPGPEGIAAEREDGRWRLSGHARHVTYGDSADILLVPAHYGASATLLAVVPARAPGVRRNTYPTMSSDRLTDVVFDAVPLDDEPVLAGVPEALVAADLLGNIAICAELVGMSARLLEMTADRVKSRHAFGAPLAALQGVQLRAADMYLDFMAARGAVVEAASLLVSGSDDSANVLAGIAAAKVAATSSALAISAGAHQLCGGWGLLDEAGLHHYTRAIKAAENQLGSPRECRAAIARYLKA
jgi:alkylation response protein AidB-like acyl-CoA dehydrogenase